MRHRGSCYCGAVSYEVDGDLRPVVACHCTQCRKQSGHYYAATAALESAFTLKGAESLTWFEASPTAKRGFCSTCGANLFWKSKTSEHISIMAGSLDGDAGIALDRHIYVADKGAYYQLDDGLPQFDGSDIGKAPRDENQG